MKFYNPDELAMMKKTAGKELSTPEDFRQALTMKQFLNAAIEDIDLYKQTAIESRDILGKQIAAYTNKQNQWEEL